MYGVCLVVRVKELLPQPWPLTVAGLPFYITTDEWDTPWPFGPGAEQYNALASATTQSLILIIFAYDSV